MDYRKLNAWTEKDHFPMPFMDQMLDRIAPEDQEKTTFTFHMGPLRSKECRLGCAMHLPHFTDV